MLWMEKVLFGLRCLGTGDEMIQFDAVDTGKGIPANKHTTIFKPGYTTKKRGWGLGIIISEADSRNYHSGKIYRTE